MSAQDGPGLVTKDGSLKALCPRGGWETMQRGMALAEAPGDRRAAACLISATTMSRIGAVRKWTAIRRLSWRTAKAKLPSVLEKPTHNNVPSRGVPFAMGAAIAPPRSNSAAEHAGCPIELSRLDPHFLETAADLDVSGSCGS